MDCIFGLISAGAGLTAQACCWWHCFKCCGCIEEREVIRTEPPPPQIVVIKPPDNNPFKNPHVPRDLHLQRAY